jgi:hypothetical protein
LRRTTLSAVDAGGKHWRIRYTEQFGVACEEREAVRRCRHGGEAVGQSDRSASLQSGGFDHADGPGQLGAERRA